MSYAETVMDELNNCKRDLPDPTKSLWDEFRFNVATENILAGLERDLLKLEEDYDPADLMWA